MTSAKRLLGSQLRHLSGFGVMASALVLDVSLWVEDLGCSLQANFLWGFAYDILLARHRTTGSLKQTDTIQYFVSPYLFRGRLRELFEGMHVRFQKKLGPQRP